MAVVVVGAQPLVLQMVIERPAAAAASVVVVVVNAAHVAHIVGKLNVLLGEFNADADTAAGYPNGRTISFIV